MVTGWAPVHTFWRLASLKLKEIFGGREGFQIGLHQIGPHLNISSHGRVVRATLELPLGGPKIDKTQSKDNGKHPMP